MILTAGQLYSKCLFVGYLVAMIVPDDFCQIGWLCALEGRQGLMNAEQIRRVQCFICRFVDPSLINNNKINRSKNNSLPLCIV